MLLRSPCSVLKYVSIVAVAFGAMACEQMEPSGSPFSAVPVQPVGTAADEADTEADDRFSDLADMPSEDLRQGATGTGSEDAVRVGAAVSPHTAPAPAPATAPQAPEVVAASVVTPVAVAPVAAAAPASTGAMGAWPVRLVRTHLDEQPPSAILALPDGRRIVVSPGDMVPERGLVVMAIGKERVQLASVSSVGDHATVTPLELSSQY